MVKVISDINWDEIMSKFSTNKASIIEFCKENKIKPHQLYHHRKKVKKESPPTFYAIPITKEETALNEPVTGSSDIRVEIGKVNIYIPSTDKAALLSIIKELAKSC